MKYEIDNIDEYIFKWLNNKFVDNSYVYKFINFLHIIIVIILLFGIFLPYKLLPYYVLFVIILLISWKLFGGCFLAKLTNSGKFIPISKKAEMIIIMSLLSIAIIQIINKSHISLFNLVFYIVNYLNENYT
jgi:hypothetical protein